MYPNQLRHYMWVTRNGNKRGMVYVNTGGRVTTGADVESAARSKDRNFTDQIYVPEFEYWNVPQETRKEEQNMSTSLWCDVDDSSTNYPNQVGHPFPSRDKGRKNMTFTDYDDDGDAHVIQGDMCAFHAARNPFFNPNASKAIAAPANVDKETWDEYVKWLERRNGIGDDNAS